MDNGNNTNTPFFWGNSKSFESPSAKMVFQDFGVKASSEYPLPFISSQTKGYISKQPPVNATLIKRTEYNQDFHIASMPGTDNQHVVMIFYSLSLWKYVQYIAFSIPNNLIHKRDLIS